MKIGVFNTVREGNTRFNKSIEKYQGELEIIQLMMPELTETSFTTHGCEAVVFFSFDKMTEKFCKMLADDGVKYILTCSAGYEHLNLEAMKKCGLKGANVPKYSPNAVSEQAVLSVLALLRNYRRQIHKIDRCDYSIKNLCGREIRNQIIGIVGAGRIGLTTIRCLHGFGPKKILAFDLYQNDEVKEYATYTSLEELYATADVIIFHCNYTPENHHMVNSKTIAGMKDGVLLVNIARGPLFDAEAVYEGIRTQKIGGVAMDVIENEKVLKTADGQTCPLPVLEKLLQFENVIYTNHTAFFTDEADRNLAEGTLQNAYSYLKTGSCQYELVK